MQPNSLQFELPPLTLFFFFLVYFVLIELNIGKRYGEFCQKRKKKRRKNKPTNQREQVIFTHFKIYLPILIPD